MLQGPYPREMASDSVIWEALAGFMRPQSGMLWYFSPVAGIQTIEPEELGGCSGEPEESSEDGTDISEEESPEE